MSYIKIHLPAILGAIIIFGNQLVPVLPAVWANLITAVLGVVALYNTGTVVNAAREAGVKGV